MLAISFTHALAVACGSDTGTRTTSPTVVVPTSVHLASEAGDAIGAGGTFDYSPANALITVRALRGRLSLSVVGDRVWSAFLVTPGDVRLAPATFTDLPAYPTLNAAGGGFRWVSQERACAPSTSVVTIDRVEYTGAALVAIDLHFEQRCGGQTAALRGVIHWRDAALGTPSGPVLPVPASLWRAPAESTPATGSYAYIEMDPAFSAGVTYPHVLPRSAGAVSVTASGGKLTIVATDTIAPLEVRGTFEAMGATSVLQEGFYHDLGDLALPGLLAGGLDVAVNSRRCESYAGWFVIDHIFYFNGLLTAIDLRFEERCSGFGTPMRGQIHWRE